MYIKELKISNYRSVPEEPIRFTPEMNFVIGENNTGKTSLLDCLERLFSKSTMPAGDFKDENNPITAYATIHFEERVKSAFAATMLIAITTTSLRYALAASPRIPSIALEYERCSVNY